MAADASHAAMRTLLSPGATFTGEKVRGAAVSVASGTLAGGLHILAVKLGMSATLASALVLYLFGNLLGYASDILFAKRDFRVPASWVPASALAELKRHGTVSPGGLFNGPLPYTMLGVRTRWLLLSFANKQFFRFLVTVLLDTLIGIALLRAAIDVADHYQVLPQWRMRDAVLAVLIAVFTFFLYTNILRFDWAYRDGDEPLMNIVVLMWATLVLMVFAVTYKRPGADRTRGV